MNNTLRIILRVLMVITWVLMMGWYVSLLLTLVQAYRMHGNWPVTFPLLWFLLLFGFTFGGFLIDG